MNLTLRDGLRFHDNQPVLARDCVASIRRWAARDAVGAKLMAATDDLSAPDDRTIRFRLNKPFPLLPFALGKTATPMCAMMPERLAQTDAFKPVPELIGSGPFRWVAQERVAGSRAVYERFTGYNPREGGTPAWTAGPKVVNFDRIQWMVIPDDATAAAALQSNEADWWEIPNSDLVPALSSGRAHQGRGEGSGRRDWVHATRRTTWRRSPVTTRRCGGQMWVCSVPGPPSPAM